MKNQFPKINRMVIALFVSILFSIFPNSSIQCQQSYSLFDVAIGVRMTNGYGLSGKLGMPRDGHYIELISYYAGYEDNDIVNITALYELTVPLTKTLNFYYGLGPGINLLMKDNEVPTEFSANGVVGIDFTFPKAPFNLSFDYLPNYSFNDTDNNYYGNGFGLTARYIFK